MPKTPGSKAVREHLAGMGIAMVPRIVLTTFPEAKLLSVHSLPPELERSQTILIWRKGTLSPKVRTLTEVLLEHSDLHKKRRGTRRNGHALASGNGGARS